MKMYNLSHVLALRKYGSLIYEKRSKKPVTFGNNPTKAIKDSSDICNSLLEDISNYEILGKQYFPKNLNLTDITLERKKI